MDDDPNDDHFSDELLEVISDLRDGRLDALARYLRSGGLPESPVQTVAIPAWLAIELADMLEGTGDGWFHLEPRGLKQGKYSWTEEARRRARDVAISYFVERRKLELGRGGYETAWREACDRFGVTKSRVDAALRRGRAHARKIIDKLNTR